MAHSTTDSIDARSIYCCAQCVDPLLNDPNRPNASRVQENELRDSEARSTAKNFALRIEVARKELTKDLEEHGNLIFSRWKKWPKVKREAMTRQVQPGMEDSSSRRYIQDPLWGQGTTFRTSNMPYLDVETLGNDPMRLLSLMHYRCAHTPGEWVPYDMSRMLGIWRKLDGQLPTKFNSKSVVMRGPGFRDLVAHDKEKCHTLEILAFPLAYKVFELQNDLLAFLCDMVKRIKGATTTQPVENRQWLAVIGSGFKLPGSVECWSQFANPFACPPVFDALRCCKQVEADLAEAEDHLALLQTNSEYLHTYIRGHNTLDPLVRLLHKVISLQMLKKQCNLVRDANRIEMQNTALENVTVPTPFDRALCGLYNKAYALCQQAKRDLLLILKDSVEFGFDRSSDLRPWFDKDKLRGLLYQLPLVRPYDTSTEEAGIFNGIDEHLARADTRERSRIDRGILQQLSFAATLQLIQTNIALSYHHVLAYRVTPMYHPEIDCTPEIAIKGKSTTMERFQKHCWPKGQRNEEWLVKADEDRRLMLELWNSARKEYTTMLTASKWRMGMIDRVMSSVVADHSPEYRAEVKAERDEVKERIPVAKRQSTTTTTSAPVQTMWGPDAREPRTEVALSRAKPKTRPAEAVLQDISNKQTVRRETSTIQTRVDGSQDRIPVNTNSLRILTLLFGVGSSKATVKWQEIVTALTDAGMVAVNSGGSAVTFRLLAGSDSGSTRIVFHKPHPDQNVDSIAQLWMGKRLNKWFGWDAGTFVERQKSS